MRVVIGYIMLMHGWGKINAGAAGLTAYMAKNGLEPGAAFAYAAMFLETVGAVCLILGLFTRIFAAAMAIEMAIAFIFVHGPKGFAAGQGGAFHGIQKQPLNISLRPWRSIQTTILRKRSLAISSEREELEFRGMNNKPFAISVRLWSAIQIMLR